MAYTGMIAEIPLGAEGLTGSKNLANVRPGQLLRATNISFEDGTLQKEGGSDKYNSTVITGAPRIIGGHDWFPSDSTQRMVIVASDGKIYKDDGTFTFATTLKSGLTVSSVVPTFAEGGKEAAANNRKLFIYTGKNALQVLSADGATTSDVSTPPADWTGTNQPTFGVPHEGRIFSGGNANDTHRMYYSTTTDHENYTGATSGSISVFPGEGEAIVGGISFKGLLVVWKRPKGIYLVDTSDATTSNWRVKKLTGSTGMMSPLARVVVDDDVLFVDDSANVQLLSAITEFGDVGSRNISEAVGMGSFIRENVNLARLNEIRGIYYSSKRRAEFAIAANGATTNSRRLIVDFNRLDLPRFSFSDKDTCEALWLRKDSNSIPRPVSGDNAGFVWLLDRETRNKDSAGYNGEFQTPHLDFGYLDPKLATVRKNGDFLELVVEPEGNWNVNVDILWDGNIKQTLTFNMGQTGAELGSFILDTDALAGDSVVNRRRRIVGSGRRFSMICRNNSADQNFSIARAYLHFRPADERMSE